MTLYIQSLRVSIDHALAVSYRRNAYDGKATFVAHITLVKGVPFYGYQVGYKYYLKIYMFNPSNMTRLADLLYQGAIMKKPLQPYESHMQYLLQWMCDFNLYGCAYIDCAQVRFRGPVPDYLELNSLAHKWHDRSIPPDFISDSDALPRQSHCSIEVDIHVRDILNRQDIKPRNIHQDFVERFADLGGDEKFVHSMAGLWRDETIRRKKRMGISNPGSSPFPPEVLVSMSADPRNTEKGGWIHEEEFRAMIDGLVKQERARLGGEKIDFNDFVKPRPQEAKVKTALESVEDLFPENLKRDVFTTKEDIDGFDDAGATQPVIDETKIGAMRDNGVDLSDAEHIEQEIAKAEEEGPIPEVAGGEAIGESSEPLKGDAAPVDDESRPDGQQYGAHFRDVQDAMPVAARGSDNHPDTRQDTESTYGSFPENTTSASTTSSPEKRARFGKFLVTSHGQASQKDGAMCMSQEYGDGHRDKRVRLSPAAVQASNINGAFSLVNTGAGSKLSAGEKRVAFSDEQEQPIQRSASSQGSYSPHKPSSQGSIKATDRGRSSTLAFQVVKNPNDPETQLRLSQKSDPSGSQKTPETPTSKAIKDETSDTSTITPGSKGRASSDTPLLSRNKISSQALRMARNYSRQFDGDVSKSTVLYASLPPTSDWLEINMLEDGLPPVIYQDAYYSDEKDVPERAREYAGREFKLQSTTLPYLHTFDASGRGVANAGEHLPVTLETAKEELAHQRRARQCRFRHWQYAAVPPSADIVEAWLLEKHDLRRANIDEGEVDEDFVQPQAPKPVTRSQWPVELSQIEGPTQKNEHGFKYSPKQQSTSVQYDTQYMSIMSLEVHVNTRGKLAADPVEDEIACVFWCVQADDDDVEIGSAKNGVRCGILALSAENGIAAKIAKAVDVEVEYEEDELELINRMISIVREFDPDVLTGYEVHNGSWGYLIERARLKYEFDVCDEFSRMKSQSHGRFGKDADRWGFTHTSTIRVTGRHMINIWRAMRGELNLLQYTMENVVFHILHKRIPHYTASDLTAWFRSSQPRDLAKVLDYFLSRVRLNIEILDANEIIARTSEQARLLGVDFFSVISRGSQFKVESLMFRIAKPENLILVSPSRKQVGGQNALECLPLVMEPQSAFYSSPLLVLDFQSLYPSVMIAYNYCYSTCLGRITPWRGTNKMGFMDFKRAPGMLELVKDHINIAPNGMMYVRPELRRSLLAKMLGEILETRVMVKSGMKVDKGDKTLQQLLNNRQLALKLIANVTYGYTSASFSGRMPCSEIADSIVQTGRETLEKAIALIHSVERWGAEVVYGDTDSLFVYLKGRTRDQAFQIGKEIAEAVTNRNPRPVKLKFEKVYHPCVLLAKKRYVGFKYESPSQTEPDFDAKGIETVRRDGTPAEQKIEEKALKILFRTADLSQVKRYFQNQCTKIMTGRISIQDFLFAKEVKLGTYSDKGPPPPGALIATRRMLEDHRLEPQYGERVPYVVVTGAPGARLIDRCVAPELLLEDESVELDAEYYISKNLIPPLERIFNLVGANVRAWYDEMPKVQRIRNITVPDTATTAGKKATLESYLRSSSCIVCRTKLPTSTPAQLRLAQQQHLPPPLPLCATCLCKPAATLLALKRRIQRTQTRLVNTENVCRSCANLPWGEEVRCDSRDCPVFYTRVREKAALRGVGDREEKVIEGLESKVEAEQGFDW